MTRPTGNRVPSRIRRLILCTGLLLVPVAGWAAHEALLPRYYTEGREVLRAFQPLNRSAQSWTVRVVCDSQPVALGTIVRPEGWILTKASSLRGIITCVTADGEEHQAEFIAYDQANDLALIKIEANDLPVVEWSDDEHQIGRWVVSVGSGALPAGVGIVSAEKMAVRSEVGTAVLGIELVEADGPPVVKGIIPSSGAERARLAVGDIVEQFEGTRLNSRGELVANIRQRRPGDLVELVIRRGDATLTVPARLAYPSGRFLSAQGMMDHMGGELSFIRSGFESVIPHDTVIPPTACGGPLINLTGKAIGINIARAGRVESYALPRSIVEQVVDRLLSEQPTPPLDYLATLQTHHPSETTNAEIDSEVSLP